jgi:hypothetical protein
MCASFFLGTPSNWSKQRIFDLCPITSQPTYDCKKCACTTVTCVSVWCCRHGGSRPGRGGCGQFIDCCEWTTSEGSSCNHSECCHAPDGFPGHRREEHGSGKGRGHQEPAPAGGFSPRLLAPPASHPNGWHPTSAREIMQGRSWGGDYRIGRLGEYSCQLHIEKEVIRDDQLQLTNHIQISNCK